MIVGEDKKYYVLIKYYNTSMCDHTLNRGIKHFCRYCLQVFSREEIVKRHISMVEENKYCTDIMEKLVMARDFEPVLNVIFVIMFMLMVML